MRTADYTAFADALCGSGSPLPEGLLSPAGTAIEDRFAVYRNNVHVGLVDALAASFPIVRAQVGEEFFQAMARDYVQLRKPADAALTFYGADFPGFIADFAPAASLPWLADLARLERAWTESWAAPDAPTLPIGALRNFATDDLLQVCVYVHPSARLVRSDWPIADLWEAHQWPSPDLEALQWRPQHVLLTRPQADVRLLCLDCAAADFTVALIAGDTVEAAAALDARLDAGAVLQQLFNAGFILELRT